MINYLWAFFIIVGILYSIIKGDSNLSNNLLTSGKAGIDMIVNLVPLMCLWLGVMKIAEKSGLLKIISNKLSKVIRVIFPEIPKGDPAISYISSNIVMNMLGLGNAATPFGIKTMKELKRLNNNSDVASRSMITFLVINTSSVTIIPTTVISLRILNGSSNPTEIITATIITTFLSTFIALILDRLFYFVWRKRYD
ncbi:MAG: nucleoside recognition domain-containing protein [Bacilli bacterium]